MLNEASESLELLRKIHDLLELLAEDKIAQRDAKQRVKLLQIAGSSIPKQKSILLMDGTRTQTEIHAVTSFNKGHLSTLVKTLQGADLLVGDAKKPNLSIKITPTLFESNASAE